MCETYNDQGESELMKVKGKKRQTDRQGWLWQIKNEEGEGETASKRWSKVFLIWRRGDYREKETGKKEDCIISKQGNCIRCVVGKENY